MSVLVFADSHNGKLAKSTHEIVYYGSQIAAKIGGSLTVVTYGSVENNSLTMLGNFGASKVLVNKSVNTDNDEQLTSLAAEAVKFTGAKVVIFAFDQIGKIVAPRLAARLGAGLVAGATALPEINHDSFTVSKNVFSGKAYATYAIHSDMKIISLLPNSVKPVSSSGSASVEEFSPALATPRVRVKEVKSISSDGIPLPEAEIVVSAGRGLKGPENWGIVEDLAKALGAATACSRPVADIGWRPHHEHVGQTGIAIRPNLYIAAGISGAIQHLAGVNGSKTIVVINTDPEAPFFKAADYGIIGDAFEVLPKLTAAVQKFKASN